MKNSYGSDRPKRKRPDPHPCIKNTRNTVCPGSSDPFYVVTYYSKWVTTSWTYSNSETGPIPVLDAPNIFLTSYAAFMYFLKSFEIN